MTAYIPANVVGGWLPVRIIDRKGRYVYYRYIEGTNYAGSSNTVTHTIDSALVRKEPPKRVSWEHLRAEVEE